MKNIKKKFFVLEVLDDSRLKIANPEEINFEKFDEDFIIMPKLD